MYIPGLVKSKRSREYDSYNETQRAQVVYAYLFKSMSHRQLDAEILNLDDAYSRGFQSMGILHHIGLVNAHKGIFEGMSVADGIEELKKAGQQFSEIASILRLMQ